MFDEAATWYEKHAERGGAKAFQAAERALHVRIALGQSQPAQALALTLVRIGKDPAVAAAALLAVGGHLRDVRKDDEARSLFTKHRTLLEKAGAAEHADALMREPAAAECDTLFGCSVLRLAGEERWSTASRAQ